MAKSYNDPVKAEARAKLRYFIEKHLFRFKKPADVRVVCLPGAEVEGEEAIEVNEVYDPLGIPRRNIVGLEMDKSKAERLSAANLGIEVVRQEAHDYFLETDKQFDVISLDYTGPQTLRESYTLCYIASRHVLNRQGIVATVYLGQRESAGLKHLLVNRLLHPYSANRMLLEGIPETSDGLKENLERIEKEEAAIDAAVKIRGLDLIRDGITFETIAIFSGGSINRPEVKHLFREDLRKRKPLDQFIEELMKGSRFLESIDMMSRDTGLPSDTIANYMSDPMLVEQAYHRCAIAKFVSKLSSLPLLSGFLSCNIPPEQEVYLPKEMALELVSLLESRITEPYHPIGIERYSYVSNKGSKMLVDYFAFSQLSKTLQNGVLDVISYEQPATEHKAASVKLNPHRWPIERFLKRCAELAEKYRGPDTFLEPRVYLGSSCYREKSDAAALDGNAGLESTLEHLDSGASGKDIISKTDAIELLRAGCSSAEIAECFKGFTKGQLAAFKSHYVTMGKEPVSAYKDL